MPGNINESGQDTLRPGGGSGGPGELKMKTISDIVSKLSALPKDDLNGFLASLGQIGKEADGVGDVAGKNKQSIAAKSSAASVKQVVKEDLANIFAGETTLSEGFIDSATTLFEAAVSTRIDEEVIALEEAAEEYIEEQKQELIEEFANRINSYVEYVAEEWIKTNELAITSGIKSDIAESFMAGQKALFETHFIEIPEEKVSLVEELTSRVELLEGQLNEKMNEEIEKASLVESAERKVITNKIAEGLTSVDSDRFAMLAENVDATDLVDFKSKATLIKETFFKKNSTTSAPSGLILEVDGDAVPVANTSGSNGIMDRYARTISSQVRQ